MTTGALWFWEQHRRHMVMTRDVSKFESLANLRVTRSKVPASEEWSELPPQACFETDASRQHTIPILKHRSHIGCIDENISDSE